MKNPEELYTIVFNARELARYLFVIGRTNGDCSGGKYYNEARQILANTTDNFNDKSDELGAIINVDYVDYYKVQSKWEEFLGIGVIDERRRAVQERIANAERELELLRSLLD